VAKITQLTEDANTFYREHCDGVPELRQGSPPMRCGKGGSAEVQTDAGNEQGESEAGSRPHGLARLNLASGMQPEMVPGFCKIWECPPIEVEEVKRTRGVVGIILI
jgi:hypothetical protein